MFLSIRTYIIIALCCVNFVLMRHLFNISMCLAKVALSKAYSLAEYPVVRCTQDIPRGTKIAPEMLKLGAQKFLVRPHELIDCKQAALGRKCLVDLHRDEEVNSKTLDFSSNQ